VEPAADGTAVRAAYAAARDEILGGTSA